MVLLLITFALLLSASNYLWDIFYSKTRKNFDVPKGFLYCQNGIIHVYVQNLGSGRLKASDFIMHKIDGDTVELKDFTIEKGQADEILSYDCGNPEGCSEGQHSISLGIANKAIHEEVYCP